MSKPSHVFKLQNFLPLRWTPGSCLLLLNSPGFLIKFPETLLDEFHYPGLRCSVWTASIFMYFFPLVLNKKHMLSLLRVAVVVLYSYKDDYYKILLWEAKRFLWPGKDFILPEVQTSLEDCFYPWLSRICVEIGWIYTSFHLENVTPPKDTNDFVLIQ